MSQIIALTTFGQVIRWVSKGRIFQHLEDRSDFQWPNGDKIALGQSLQISTSTTVNERHVANDEGMASDTSSTIAVRRNLADNTISSPPSGDGVSSKDFLADIRTHDDSTNAFQPQPHDSASFGEKTILVDWYGDKDPENPKNWSIWVRAMIYLQINLYTLTVYMSSSIFSATSKDFSEHYGTSTAVTSLGLALYVLGYGIGPMLFSPLSEIPSIGRNPPYVISFSIYVILSVPTAMVRNVPGFMVLRLLQGFFGSPCLATGGASLADVTSFTYLPYGLFVWSIACLAAPAMAPTIAGYTVMQKDWTWPMWEILWSTAPCLAFLFFLPETSGPTILLRRARRLRNIKGNPNFKSQSEIDQKQLSFARLAQKALLIPWKINALDPAILFTTIYIGLVYAIFYSFFEVFPLVYQDLYGMDLGQLGLVFLTSIVASVIVMPFYFMFLHYAVNRVEPTHPEQRLIPALLASLLVPVGLFIFAWTSRESIHWIVPTAGVLLVMVGISLIFQCLFTYISITYARYAASLFAMNGLIRSSLAFASILWSAPLYQDLGVARGTSLIGGLTIGCVFGIFALYLLGPELRKRSRFAE